MRFRTGFALLAILGGCAAEPLLRFGPGIATPDDQTLQLGLQDALTESKPTRGNRVVLLRDGVRTLPAMFAAMAAARDHINLEYFTFDNIAANPSPPSGAANGVANGVANGAASAGARTLADLLLDRLAYGVQVDIIYDAFGSQDTDAAFIDRLRKAGAHVLAFNPGLVTKAGTLINPNDRDHRKILVVDGRAAFIGGVNLDPVYENRHPEPDGDSNVSVWRDVDARIDGPAVADLQRLFLDTWRKQSSESLPPRDWFPPVGPSGREVIRIIGSAPGEDRPLYYVSVMTAIHASRHSISVSTGYFVPTHQEREELALAARRGVRVRLVLPGTGKSDFPSALAAGRAAYGDLLEAGVEIVELRDDVLHAKIMVVDGVWTAIGSSNLDRRSVAFNNEVDAIILGRDTAAAMEMLLDRNRARGTRIDLASWRARGLWERPRELIARLWQFVL